MPLRIAALAAVAATASAFTCGSLTDQDSEYIFRRPLVPGDDSSLFTGNISYSCNETTGGVTYLQNLLFSFQDQVDPNATLTLSASAPPRPPPFFLSRAAACLSSL